MRIFYILNNRWPTVKAHGFQVAKTCEALQRAGVCVELIIPRRRLHAEITRVDPLQFYGVRNRFAVTRLPSLDTTNGALLFSIQQTLFALVAAAYLMFKRGTIYTRDPFTAYILTFVRRNVFWEAHRFPAKPDSRFYRRLFRSVSGIVVITHGLKKLFIERGVPSERVAVIADAVDPDEFAISETTQEARRTLGLPLELPLIGYVGQLTTFGESKGIDDLLHAFIAVRARHPGALLLIVGGNRADIQRHQRLAADLGLDKDAILFTGNQPHEKVPLYLRAADVLAMPYPNTEHYAHFMSPLKLFEYLAGGKPIVTTDLPSVREIVGDDDVVFVRPNDPDDMARGIVAVLDDPIRAARKGERSLALARQHSWLARARAIAQFISEHFTTY